MTECLSANVLTGIDITCHAIISVQFSLHLKHLAGKLFLRTTGKDRFFSLDEDVVPSILNNLHASSLLSEAAVEESELSTEANSGVGIITAYKARCCVEDCDALDRLQPTLQQVYLDLLKSVPSDRGLIFNNTISRTSKRKISTAC
jgi:hypothetical protein